MVDSADNRKSNSSSPAVPLDKRDGQPVNPVRPVAEAAAPPGAAGGDLRASDADRDRIAEILREALAEGRLDPEEHAERIDVVYRAKTLGELEPVVRDLPAAGTASRPQSAPGAAPSGAGATGPDQNLVAVFSASTRKGRWQVPARINAVAIFGSVEIDLTEALFPQQQIQINATSIFGSVEIRVPENVTLRSNGSGVLGSFEVETHEAGDDDAPLVMVNGFAVLGSVEAKPRRGAWIRDLRDRWREERRERHTQLRDDRRELRDELRDQMRDARRERHAVWDDHRDLRDRLRDARRERRDRYR